MKNVKLIIAAGFILASTQTMANNSHADQRADKQQQRIDQGVKKGTITGSEAIRLKRQQRLVDHKKKQYGADGVWTQEERDHLKRLQNRANRSIYRQKHDRQTRNRPRNTHGKKVAVKPVHKARVRSEHKAAYYPQRARYKNDRRFNRKVRHHNKKTHAARKHDRRQQKRNTRRSHQRKHD